MGSTTPLHQELRYSITRAKQRFKYLEIHLWRMATKCDWELDDDHILKDLQKHKTKDPNLKKTFIYYD